MIASDEPFRSPTPYERELLERLCSVEIHSRHEYRAQVDHCSVREEGGAADLRIKVGAEASQVPSASKYSRPISEGRFEIRGGILAAFLLFARDGYLYFLEKHTPPSRVASEVDWMPPLRRITFTAFTVSSGATRPAERR